jgi:hypothetical protein
MDPLSLIRQAHQAKTTLQHMNGAFIISGTRLEDDMETCFKRGVKGAGALYYTVHEIIFFLDYMDSEIVEYRTAAMQSKIRGIAQPDKENLKNYLNGLIDECPQIDTDKQRSQRRQRESVNGGSSYSNNNHVSDNTMETEEDDIAGEEVRRLQEKRQIAEDLKQSYDANPTDENRKLYYAADNTYLSLLRKNDIPAYTRTTIMEHQNADFTFALDLFKQVLRDRDTKGNHNSNVNSSSAKRNRASMGSTGLPNSQFKRVKGLPIIIVPNSLTTTISNLNVKDFLVNGSYVPILQRKKEGAKRIPTQTLSLPLGHGLPNQDIVVTDAPNTLKASDWDRVVAVFVLGEEWQFKPMKWKTPVELFQNVLGIHVCMDDVDLSKNIQSWKCTVVRVNDSRRHLDQKASSDVKKALHTFIKMTRPWLLK